MLRVFHHSMQYGVALAVFSVIVAITTLALWGFYDVGNDDDFITLWAGQALGTDWWFINYNGERSEMSSSILAALVAKLAHILLPEAAYAVNKFLLFIFLPASLWACWRYRHYYLPGPYAGVGALATIIVGGLSPSLLYASLTGLETPLQSFLLTVFAFTLAGYAMQPDAKLARSIILLQMLLLLVRPEGFWCIGAGATVLLLVFGTEVFKRHCIIWLLPCVFFISLIAVRWLATGLPFPNPYYAKVMLTPEAAHWGLQSLVYFYMMLPVRMLFGAAFIVASLYIAWRLWRRSLLGYDRAMLALLAVIAGQNVFFALTCGDTIVWLNRFMAPVLLLEAALVFHLVMRISAVIPKQPMAILCCIIAVWAGIAQWQAIEDRARFAKVEPAKLWQKIQDSSIKQLNWHVIQWNRRHDRDIKAVHSCIKHRLAASIKAMGQVRVLTYQAGFFPYYLKERYPKADIRFFDTKGLIQPDAGLIAREKDSKGAVGGEEFAPLLIRKDKMSSKIQSFNPNLIYALEITEADLEQLPSLGWKRLCFLPASEVWIKLKK